MYIIGVAKEKIDVPVNKKLLI